MRRQRRFISIPLEVIEKLMAGESPTKLSKIYGVNKQTLKKRKRDILSGIEIRTR